MFVIYKKLIFSTLFNFSLFLLLIIGIQNSNQNSKVYLFINETIKLETIKLPISFIIGVSFITGSVFGSFMPLNSNHKK